MTREEADVIGVAVEFECETCGSICSVYEDECRECGATFDFAWYREEIEELLEDQKMYSKEQQLKKVKKPRKKKCKNCREWFTPEREMQSTCNITCAIAYANKDEVKQKEINKKKRAFKQSDKSKLRETAQFWFNKFIRLRDKDEPCISCGHTQGRQFHAGHYKPAGANPQLRFNELNVHKQCSICNNYKSGNLAEYRKNLIKKIGIKNVEALEQDKSTKKYSIEDYANIIVKYKSECKDLQI